MGVGASDVIEVEGGAIEEPVASLHLLMKGRPSNIVVKLFESNEM